MSFFILTHWRRVTHICVSNLGIIGSDNGLSPGRRHYLNQCWNIVNWALGKQLQWNCNLNPWKWNWKCRHHHHHHQLQQQLTSPAEENSHHRCDLKDQRLSCELIPWFDCMTKYFNTIKLVPLTWDRMEVLWPFSILTSEVVLNWWGT